MKTGNEFYDKIEELQNSISRDIERIFGWGIISGGSVSVSFPKSEFDPDTIAEIDIEGITVRVGRNKE